MCHVHCPSASTSKSGIKGINLVFMASSAGHQSRVDMALWLDGSQSSAVGSASGRVVSASGSSGDSVGVIMAVSGLSSTTSYSSTTMSLPTTYSTLNLGCGSQMMGLLYRIHDLGDVAVNVSALCLRSCSAMLLRAEKWVTKSFGDAEEEKGRSSTSRDYGRIDGMCPSSLDG